MLAPTDLMRISALVLSVTLCTSAFACDGGDSKPRADPAAAARAKEKAERDEVRDELRKKREAEQKAKEEAEAAKKAAIAKVLVLPEEMPKKLDKACAAVAEAHDGFMNRMFEDETTEKWNQAKGTQLPMTVSQCTKEGSLEVAACQANALNTAPQELAKELPELLRGCIDEFGEKDEGATPPA